MLWGSACGSASSAAVVPSAMSFSLCAALIAGRARAARRDPPVDNVGYRGRLGALPARGRGGGRWHTCAENAGVFGGRRHDRPPRGDRGARPAKTKFDVAELGAIAHLYRGEVYRSTIWRTRLDQTTNWAVVTTGLAMSLTFSGPYASPLPLILVGLLVVVFLLLESRRYRYFNVWRARCRLMETDIYGPMLRGEGVTLDGKWNTLLANDYEQPRFHISYLRAIGRRLRRNYALHPGDPGDRLLRQAGDPPDAGGDLARPSSQRAAVGPLPGLAGGAGRGGLPRHLDRAGAGDAPDRAQAPGRGEADLDRRAGGRRTTSLRATRSLTECKARSRKSFRLP